MSDSDSNPFEDLVIALLAVNHWDIEKAAAIADGLRKHGFFSPEDILSRELPENALALQNAGYNRGNYMQMLMATRLMDAAMAFASSSFTETLVNHIQNRDREAIRALLEPIEGVGNMVFENFSILQGIQ